MKKICAVLLSVVLLAACGGPLAKLQDAVDLAPSFIAALEVSGAIKQELGDKLTADFKDIQTAVDETKDGLSKIPSDASDKKLREFQVYSNLNKEVQAILARHDFSDANNPKVNAVVTLVKEIVNILVNRANPNVVGAGAAGTSDEVLKNKIDELNNLLKNK